MVLRTAKEKREGGREGVGGWVVERKNEMKEM